MIDLIKKKNLILLMVKEEEKGRTIKIKTKEKSMANQKKIIYSEK